jgi:hypothetical protein
VATVCSAPLLPNKFDSENVESDDFSFRAVVGEVKALLLLLMLLGEKAPPGAAAIQQTAAAARKGIRLAPERERRTFMVRLFLFPTTTFTIFDAVSSALLCLSGKLCISFTSVALPLLRIAFVVSSSLGACVCRRLG